MASAQKPTGTRRRTTTRAKKPATIDLKATEVKAEAEAEKPTSAAKAESKPDAKTESAEKKFGRDAAKSGAKAADAAKTQTTEKKQPEKPSAQPSVKPSGSSGGGIRSGLIGGVLGSLATVVGLGAVGQTDGASNIPLIGSLYERGGNAEGVIDLTERLAALESAGEIDLGPIEERIAKLETAPAGDLSVVETEIASLKEAVNAISNAVSSGGEASAAEVTAALAVIASRLDVVEKNANAATDGADFDSALAKILELEENIASLSQAEQVDLSPVENKLAEIQSTITALSQSVESNSQSVAALNEQSDTLENTVASVKQSEKVARSVAVNALGTALENDDPIGLALASVKSLIGETAETERLNALVESGIPTRKALLAELEALTSAIQNPEADVTAGSLSDRFWGSMQNLVTFRSSGPLEGDSPVAILSRVKSNLEQGDLSGLLSEWQKLPQAVQTSGESFKANVEARMEAISLYEKINDSLAANAG